MYQPDASNIADPMSRLPVSSDLPEVIDDAKDYIRMLSVDAVPLATLWGEIQVGSEFVQRSRQSRKQSQQVCGIRAV